MNAAEHNELTSLIRALPPLEEALSEGDVDHLMLLPTGRWTARQQGVARRRTSVLDEPALLALATWVDDHPGARLDGTWLFDVIPGVRGLLVTAERCPTPIDDIASPVLMDALKKQITRGENGVILGPVRAPKLELLCWIAQQFIQEQIILISDRPPTAQLGPRVVHLYPPRTPEELARTRRLLRRCDAVLWDEVENSEMLRVALGHPGAKRRWFTMDAATTRAGFEALGRRLEEMAPGDLSSIMLADSRSGKLSHLLRRVGGSWQEVTEEANSMLPALEAHLETRFAVRNRYEEYRSTVEVQEIRFESDDPPHEDEPEDIDIKEFKPRHGEGGLDGISELLSEAEEQVEEQPSHALAASSIDELLEDSEGTDTSEVSDSVVQEVLDEPSTPAKEPLEFTTEDSEPSEELDEVGQTPSLQTQSGEEEEEVALLASEQPEETSSTKDALALEESAAQDTSLSDFDKQFIETSPGPDAPIDLGEDSVEDSEPEQDEESVSEEVGEEVDEASSEELDEEERDEGPISQRLTEQIDPEEIQAAVEARERELAKSSPEKTSHEFSEFELEEMSELGDEASTGTKQQLKNSETMPGDSLAAMQDALSQAEAEINASFSSDGDLATNPVIETPDVAIDIDEDIPIITLDDSPATQEFYVEDPKSGVGDRETAVAEVSVSQELARIEDTRDELGIMLDEFPDQNSIMKEEVEVEVNLPEDTNVDHQFALDPDVLVDDERRAHLNDLLRIEAELNADLATDDEVTGLHVDPQALSQPQEPKRPDAGQVIAEEMFSALDEIYSEASLQPPEAPEGITPPEAGDPTVLTSIPEEPTGREVPVDDDDVPLLSWDDDEETKQHERSRLAGAPSRQLSDEDPPDADVSTSTSVKLNALSQRLRALRQRRQQKSGQFNAYSKEDGEEEERQKQPTNLLEALKRDKKS